MRTLLSGKAMLRATRVVGVAAVILTVAAGPASAHPHTVDGHPIADGQLHPKFVADGTSCDTYPVPGGQLGAAWYGLETAHHGPDQGTAGKGDGCYQTTVVQLSSGAWVPSVDRNPAID